MKNKILLFSTGCPKCNVLIKKLNLMDIDYDIESNDMSEMLNLGFTEVPVLKVDDKYMTFKEANNWINTYKGE